MASRRYLGFAAGVGMLAMPMASMVLPIMLFSSSYFGPRFNSYQLALHVRTSMVERAEVVWPEDGETEAPSVRRFGQRRNLVAVKNKIKEMLTTAYWADSNQADTNDQFSAWFASNPAANNFPRLANSNSAALFITNICTVAGVPTNYLDKTPFFGLSTGPLGWTNLTSVIHEILWVSRASTHSEWDRTELRDIVAADQVESCYTNLETMTAAYTASGIGVGWTNSCSLITTNNDSCSFTETVWTNWTWNTTNTSAGTATRSTAAVQIDFLGDDRAKYNLTYGETTTHDSIWYNTSTTNCFSGVYTGNYQQTRHSDTIESLNSVTFKDEKRTGTFTSVVTDLYECDADFYFRHVIDTAGGASPALGDTSLVWTHSTDHVTIVNNGSGSPQANWPFDASDCSTFSQYGHQCEVLGHFLDSFGESNTNSPSTSVVYTNSYSVPHNVFVYKATQNKPAGDGAKATNTYTYTPSDVYSDKFQFFAYDGTDSDSDTYSNSCGDESVELWDETEDAYSTYTGDVVNVDWGWTVAARNNLILCRYDVTNGFQFVP